MTANESIYKKIKEMQIHQKNHPTKTEILMWEYLRNQKTGYKIRRQHIIECFITDFVCLKKKVVIEIDGGIHIKQKEYDKYRTEILTSSGFEVIRFSNEEVLKDPAAVALQIKGKLDSIIPF